METPNQPELHWRETYFIYFSADQRPAVKNLQGTLRQLNERFELENLQGNDDGYFESILVNAPDDHAALEISYEAGDAVAEQSSELAKQLRAEVDSDQLAQLIRANARLDIMHFETVGEDDEVGTGDLDELESFDPGSLLLVVEALTDLTEGIPIDPASGAVVL